MVWVGHRGVRLVEDSPDIQTREDAATIGLEIAEQAAEIDTVLSALGGGAMATGAGHILKTLAPHIEIICVQPHGAPAMTRSWHARGVVTTDTMDTIADGVAGRFPIPEVLQDLLQVADDAVLVHEASITADMRLLLRPPAWSSPPQPWAWPPSWRTAHDSPTATSSPSSAAATSTRPPPPMGHHLANLQHHPARSTTATATATRRHRWFVAHCDQGRAQPNRRLAADAGVPDLVAECSPSELL